MTNETIENLKKNENWTELRTEDGWTIFVSRWGKFTARHRTYPEANLQADSLDGVRELIKEHLQETRRFTPINVIHVGYEAENTSDLGRLTSRVAGAPRYVHFSHVPDYGKAGDRKTSTQDWLHDTNGKPRFVEQNPHNLKVRTAILNRVAEIHALNKQIDQLRSQYTHPVTWESIGAREQAKE